MSNFANTWPGKPDGTRGPVPPVEWPKIMHTLMTGACNEYQYNDREMTADTITVANGQTANFVMGVSAVKREHYADISVPRGDGKWVLRYTWTINGVPLHMKIFNSDKRGKMGRLIREGSAPLGELEWRKFKK